MNTCWYCLFGAMAVVFIYLLYSRGIVVTKSIVALFFAFRTGKGGDRAKLNSCTGWVRHMVRFRESRIYTFVLNSRLTRGEAAVSLLDRNKRELLRLDRQLTVGSAELDRKSKYYLCWDFKSATGTCALHWQIGSDGLTGP